MNSGFRFTVFTYFGLLICLFSSNNLFSQIYAQGNLQYSFYDYSKPLDLVEVSPDLSFGMGIMIFANQKSKFEIAGELNTFRRNFHQKFDGDDFKYIFSGVEARLLTNYSISEKWFLELGFIAATYGPSLTLNGERVVLGDGFRDTDIGTFIGGHYFLAKSWIVGARFDVWFSKMLEYELIGDYGDLQPPVKDIRANTLEVFIRFQFLNQWK